MNYKIMTISVEYTRQTHMHQIYASHSLLSVDYKEIQIKSN